MNLVSLLMDLRRVFHTMVTQLEKMLINCILREYQLDALTPNSHHECPNICPGTIVTRWCKWYIAKRLACGAYKSFQKPGFESRVKRASQFKKYLTAVSTTERYFTLSVVYLIVECTRRQRTGNSRKKHSDCCRPA